LHTTSSPKFPQSNGKAEKADRTVKNLLKKSQDPYMAMLTYQSSPLWNGFSPAEMLISRQLHANLPMTHTQLLPSVPDFAMLKAKEEEQRMKQKSTFDCRHAVQDLDPLLPSEQVWVTDHNTTENVVEPIAPRSYRVSIPTGVMDDIHYSHIRVIYLSRPCALGLALRSVCNIFALQMALVVLTINTLLKLCWISVTD